MITVNNHLALVDERNKSFMHETLSRDMLYYFELNEWFATNAFRNFSVKLVLKGAINYKIGNTVYTVKENQAFIGNRQPDVKSYFDSKEPVKSVCLNIEMDTMAEAHAVMTAKKELNFDNLRSRHFNDPVFAERVYNIGHNDFLAPLHTLAKQLAQDKRKQPGLDQEFFLNMSEKIILQLYETSRACQSLDCVRNVTKREILRRLDMAKNFLEENYLERPSVSQLANYCNMSEFHFFRSFRQAFNITPYQLQLKLRLEKARGLIKNSRMSFTDISMECAFPDLSTFSKAYKRMYQELPSALKRNHFS